MITPACRELYERAIAKWGVDAQVAMAVEECAELIVTLQHLNRRLKEVEPKELTDEVADVLVMLEQLQVMFGISGYDLYAAKMAKLSRLKERLDDG